MSDRRPTSVLLDGLHCVKHALRFAPDLVHEVRVRDRDRARALAQRLAPDVADELLRRPVSGPRGAGTAPLPWRSPG